VANLDEAQAIRDELQGDLASSTDGGQNVPQPTGFANLSGSFVFDGPVPAPADLGARSDDFSICRPDNAPVLSDALLVDDQTKVIRNVLIFLTTRKPKGFEDDPRWEAERYAASRDSVLAGTAQGFDQHHCVFSSHVFAMRTSQTVEIINSDPVGHNTNIPDLGFNQTIAAGSKAELQPTRVANSPMPVSRSIHNWMKAYMITRDNPYFAVSGRTGGFEMLDAPAGVELEFRIWHEKSGFLSGDVTLNGELHRIKGGRLKLTLAPDQPQELKFVLPAAMFD